MKNKKTVRLWGVTFPPEVTKETWADDAARYLGSILDSNKIVPSIMDDDWFVISEPKPNATPDPDDIFDMLPHGAPIHKDALIPIEPCTCPLLNISSGIGCRCGGIDSERKFKVIHEERLLNVKRNKRFS